MSSPGLRALRPHARGSERRIALVSSTSRFLGGLACTVVGPRHGTDFRPAELVFGELALKSHGPGGRLPSRNGAKARSDYLQTPTAAWTRHIWGGESICHLFGSRNT